MLLAQIKVALGGRVADGRGGGFSLRSIYSEGKARPGLLAAAHCVISDLVGDMREDSRPDPLPSKPKDPEGDKP